MHALERLGWNDHFAASLASLRQPQLVPARIIAEHRGRYRVACPAGEMPAEVTGRMMFLAEERLDYPVVGDWTAVEVFDKGALAIIHQVLPRTSILARKYAGRKAEGQAIAANVDVIFIVIGLDHNFNMNRVERYLAVAAGSGAQAVVLLSKSDLVPDAEDTAKLVRERTGGAPVYPVSARTGAGMEQVRQALGPGRTACCVGSSGVGKSSIINNLAGRELLKTAEVREADSRGRHTTSHRELFVLESGGIVIDTPGMRELGLWDSAPGIEQAFADIETAAAGCAFTDCTHRSEPGCAVLEAVAAGEISRERYESYLKLEREQERLAAKTDPFKQQEKKARDKALSKVIRDYEKKRGKTSDH